MSGDDHISLERIYTKLDSIEANNERRFNKMEANLDKLQAHHVLVPQLEKKVDKLEDNHLNMVERVQGLENDNKHREDMKKRIMNPFINAVIKGALNFIFGGIMVLFYVYANIDPLKIQNHSQNYEHSSHR